MSGAARTRPLRLAVAGLVHQHVEGLLWRAREREDLELVGIAEPDVALFDALAERYGLAPSLRFDALEDLLDAARPEAVSVMTSIADHRAVVEACAARGVHLLVEKPLAFDADEARAMARAAERGGVALLTNFETSWYRSVRELGRRVRAGRTGTLRRMVFRHGHRGPLAIGCREEFVRWLTDPARNGGGALVDFGCYGALLATWLMDGARPLEVRAVASTLDPERHPHVDDDATVVLRYPTATAVVQASWAWTHDLKECDVYGERGSLHAGRGAALVERAADGEPRASTAPALPAEIADEWTHLRAVVRGAAAPDPLAGVELNLVVAEILAEARRQVARPERHAGGPEAEHASPGASTPPGG